jgi:hypothetical protein
VFVVLVGATNVGCPRPRAKPTDTDGRRPGSLTAAGYSSIRKCEEFGSRIAYLEGNGEVSELKPEPPNNL